MPSRSQKQINPLLALKENPFVLAPMAGITDHAFRSYMRELGAGVVVSELISATGLEYKSKRTEALMSFSEEQRPVGIQIFGENPEHVAHAARFVEEKGADFVDLNFGCPVPKVVKKGAGSAMLKDLPAMKALLRAVVTAVKIPVMIKIRTGWDQNSKNANEVVRLAADEGISWVAIHGRTRAQGYEGLADWELIGQVKAKNSIPIIGNGDVVTAQQAVQRLSEYGLDGVMIGRGALKNPFIFQESFALWRGDSLNSLPEQDLYSAFLKLRDYIVAHCEGAIVQIQLKKFAAWYSTGYPGAAQFRKNIFQVSSTTEILETTFRFFKTTNENQSELKMNGRVESQDQLGPSNDGFLMGGHG